MGCASGSESEAPIEDAARPKLVGQRVTATVRREAARLVRVETEREAFLTTPEHPFATPQSGWIPAAKLAVGDRVVSAKFGTVRVTSLRSERPSRSVPVFNLTVNPSHAYLVGMDQVLVHNVDCKDHPSLHLLQTRKGELREAKQKLAEHEATLKAFPERQAELQPEIDKLKESILKINKSIEKARARLKKAGIDPDAAPSRPPPPPEDATTRNTRELERINREIERLQQDPRSTQDNTDIQKELKDLKKERRTFQKRLDGLKLHESKKRGEHLTKHEKLLLKAEDNYESAKKKLKATQDALRDLDARPPRSNAEYEATLPRKAELRRTLREQEGELVSADQIRAWEREVAQFERAKLTKSERPELAQHINDLKDKLAQEKVNKEARKYYRKIRQDPNRRMPPPPDHRKIKDQRRQQIELMEAELVTLRQQPASPARDGRIAHLEAAVQTLKSLAEIRRKIRKGKEQLRIARLRRATLEWRDKPTTTIDEKIARLLKEQETRKAERTTLVARALSLGLKESRRRRAPHGIDNDRHHAFELELADPDLDADRLAELEHQFGEVVGDAPDALDADFFQEIWREAGNDAAHELDGGELDVLDPDFLEGLLRDIGDGDAGGELDGLDPEFLEGLLRDIGDEDAAPHEPGHGAAGGVDATPPARAQSPPRRPSPEPAAPAASGFQALHDELRAQRSAFEKEIQDLIHQHAEQSQALAGPGSSRHAEGVQRLRAIEAALQELQQRWRQQMQNRLDRTRQQLQTMQSIGRLRNETIEADLARQIERLEYEVQNPSF